MSSVSIACSYSTVVSFYVGSICSGNLKKKGLLIKLQRDANFFSRMPILHIAIG